MFIKKMGTSVVMSVEPVMSVEFEIFGKVQGMFLYYFQN